MRCPTTGCRRRSQGCALRRRCWSSCANLTMSRTCSPRCGSDGCGSDKRAREDTLIHRFWFLSAAVRGGLAACCLVLAASAARADDAALARFYKGRNIQLYIGYSAGGGYDIYARVLARHLSDQIPGNPTIVPQNMPGAGSLRLANYLYNVAPKDGTAFATFARGMATEPLLGGQGTQFDARNLTWFGIFTDRVDRSRSWHTSGVPP